GRFSPASWPTWWSSAETRPRASRTSARQKWFLRAVFGTIPWLCANRPRVKLNEKLASEGASRMKRRLTLALLVCLSYLPFATRPMARVTSDTTRIGRLVALGRLWGAIKFFHPYLAYKEIDWDAALVETIPKVNEAKSADEYRAAVAHMLSFLNDPNTRALGG